MADRIDLSNIFINFLKKARYQRHIDEGTLVENQFYATTDGNEQCEYGDLFGNIEDQKDLYNALCSARLFKKDMCNDPRGYAIVKALKNSLQFDMSPFIYSNTNNISNFGILTCDAGMSNRNDTVALPNSYISNANTFEISFNISFDFKGNYNYILSTDTCHIYITNNRNSSNNFTWWTPDVVWRYNSNRLVGFTKNKDIAGQKIYDTDDRGLIIEQYGNIKVVFGRDKQKVYIRYYNNNDDSLIVEYTATRDIQDLRLDDGNLTFGYGFNGRIDLASIKIIADEEEVFSNKGIIYTGIDKYPLYNVNIPYMNTKDGVKIVDVQYKDRVDAIYEATGNDNYIIIDEVNETFRLPMQDIHSQLERKTSFTLRKWED